MRTTTGQCTLGDSARSIASVVFGVDAIVAPAPLPSTLALVRTAVIEACPLGS